MLAGLTNKTKEKMLNRFDRGFIQNTKADIKNEKHSLNFFWFWTIPLYIILLFFFIFFTWYTIFVSTHGYFWVQGASMKNTFNNTVADTDARTSVDAVYINKNERVSTFDVVVVKDNSGETVIKRVMAQEGDYITILKGEYDGHNCFYFYRIPANVFKTMDKTAFDDESAKLVEDSGAYEIMS